MELSPAQILIVGLVASGLGAAIRLIVAKFGGAEISKAWMTIIVSAVAFVLAVLFNIPEFPIYVDPLQYAGELTLLISAYLGFATLIYNIILDKVLDKVGLDAAEIAAG